MGVAPNARGLLLEKPKLNIGDIWKVKCDFPELSEDLMGWCQALHPGDPVFSPGEVHPSVIFMTRSWNQTKNNTNLRHIATGRLRTYKSRNLSEAIATVRISCDRIYVYIYMYIYIYIYIYRHHWKTAQDSQSRNLFPAQSWDMGNSDRFKSNGVNWTLLDVPFLDWILLRSIANWNSIQKQIKHFA